MLKIQIIYQKIQKNKTNSIQNNIPEAGRRLWWYGRTLQSVMDYITPNFMYHSKMDTKHITGNIIHMIHSTKFGTINYYTSFLPLCPCLLTIVPYPWSILII